MCRVSTSCSELQPHMVLKCVEVTAGLRKQDCFPRFIWKQERLKWAAFISNTQIICFLLLGDSKIFFPPIFNRLSKLKSIPFYKTFYKTKFPKKDDFQVPKRIHFLTRHDGELTVLKQSIIGRKVPEREKEIHVCTSRYNSLCSVGNGGI